MRKFFITFFLLLLPLSLPAISNAVISNNDYRFTLSLIRELNIIIDNFGTDEEREEYKKIRTDFQIAAERHYARDFITVTSLTYKKDKDEKTKTSVELFYELKIQLIELYSKLSDFYIYRSENLLGGISKSAIDIIIEYGRGGGKSKYFFSRPINPLRDKKPYDASKFHYFRMRSSIERQLDSGYRYLQDARKVFDDVDYIYILSKKKKTSRELSYIIEKHRSAIILSRQSKECGLAIYQTLNRHKMGNILLKYDVSDTYVRKYPIYDDRLPERFKVDATDNRRLLFSVEKKRVGEYDKLNPKSIEQTNPNKQRRDKKDESKSSDKTEEPAK